MAAWLHHGNDPTQELNCLTSLGRSTSHIRNKTKLSSLSIDRQLKFKITAWPKLGNKAEGNGNKSRKCTGSYFTAVKVSSLHPMINLAKIIKQTSQTHIILFISWILRLINRVLWNLEFRTVHQFCFSISLSTFVLYQCIIKFHGLCGVEM